MNQSKLSDICSRPQKGNKIFLWLAEKTWIEIFKALISHLGCDLVQFKEHAFVCAVVLDPDLRILVFSSLGNGFLLLKKFFSC